MRLDEILHNSTGPPSHYSGTDWVDSALDNLPLTPLTNSNSMTPVDDSFEFLDSNGQRCRRFPAGPNRTLAYTTMRSSVHQSYGPIDDPVAEEAQLLAAHQFRNIYANPNRSFLTSSSTSVNTNPSGATVSPSFGTRTVQSHHLGHPSESSHQGILVEPSNNRFHPYPSVGTTSQATPKRGAQMANAELTPRGPRLNRPTRGINHSTSPTGLSTVLLDLDDEIDLLEDHSRAPLDSSRQSPQGSPVPENEEALATLPVNRTIMIDFHFHLPVREEATTARKKKTDVPKTRVYKSEAGKVTICWDVSNTDLLSFKSAVITAIVTEAGRSLAGFLERSEGVGNITWYGSIHHGGPFAASQNQQLARPGVFSAWLAACQEVGNKGRKMTCKLHQKDPKDLAENAAALAGLTQLDNPGPSAEPVFQPSTAAIDRAKINEYIGQILATYSPKPRLSGSSDKSVFVNPEKTHEYFVISMRVAEAWGKAMHLSPETVDLRTPPKTPMFDYITGPLESDPTPPSTIPQQPAPPYPYPPYPHGYPPPMGYHLQYPYQAAAPATQGLPPPGSPSQDRNQVHGPANAQPDSSPAPSDTEGEDNISSFLSYARVDPNSSAVRDGLAELGITHWSMFRHVQASELMTAGVPMGPARTIVVAAKRYSDRLKSRARARQA
ncbi:hypothetical protein PGT21_029214 [Puccinia graminis f. sp. tritici]|uniref:SAM domain-containing protein n=2 Tax=Puccinia graminis f. sp. tritici TaxID=56615 RepID=E3KH69_PUCGT|nr:uncharacterized protein PGTG_09357 [Puccinia graminis f. sp. tritici CRL 75-36-700-3]EFP83644.1 hypothetical protein PGTG_09357 [Puccinia graminis f. sp. tritici CRL 75-36-700-3]KAA1066364.1 hypothetical protein PGT21_029214 [Puccinia graminis f. sp. tritici]KAA1128312.1 hypothetical protein PGTUg99_005416 [Puccinia graminis f. sp. tritici]